MIDGVKLKRLRVIPDERGRLAEILRSDEQEFFIKFGQVYITTAYPGVVKAWHYHKKQYDNFACIHGMMKVALYDARDESPTKGEVNEFFVGEHNPMLIQIPPGVMHGFKCISEYEAIVVNIPTEVYNYDEPDEFRVDPFDNEIPYDWAIKQG
ncbi:dTDP-4-dehydrorhamnose 3,5-epimerase family protein [Candidatus Sumerlaeota bacterium]|nr:dTDP-4-dehydrorhamnose 3,5-epimerase family protein [Candidatus Sumerlaeota bacterium]